MPVWQCRTRYAHLHPDLRQPAGLYGVPDKQLFLPRRRRQPDHANVSSDLRKPVDAVPDPGRVESDVFVPQWHRKLRQPVLCHKLPGADCHVAGSVWQWLRLHLHDSDIHDRNTHLRPDLWKPIKCGAGGGRYRHGVLLPERRRVPWDSDLSTELRRSDSRGTSQLWQFLRLLLPERSDQHECACLPNDLWRADGDQHVLPNQC